MRINHYLTFSESDEDVFNLINELRITCKGDYGIKFFNIYEEDEAFIKMKPYIESGKIDDFCGNAKYEYSQEEINESEWFRIRSTHHWSYPQPEDEYINITYDSESIYCKDCGQG